MAFYFLATFYTDHINFHISTVMSEF